MVRREKWIPRRTFLFSSEINQSPESKNFVRFVPTGHATHMRAVARVVLVDFVVTLLAFKFSIDARIALDIFVVDFVVFVDEVFIRFDVFSQAAGIRVPLRTTRDFTLVRFFHLMRPGVFESVTGIRIRFVAAGYRTDVGLFTAVGPRMYF